jgi:hypothetical protein
MHIDYTQIRKQAAVLRGQHETSDPFRLARRLGIKILYEDLGECEDAVRGFFFQDKCIETITLNHRLLEKLQPQNYLAKDKQLRDARSYGRQTM